MFNKNVLGIQFLENAIKFTYKEKNKKVINHYHHEMNTDSGLKTTLELMVEDLKANSRFKDFESTDVVICLPNNIVKVDTLLNTPAVLGLKGRNLLNALELHLENTLEITKDKNMFSILTDEEISDKKERKMTIISSKKEDLDEFPKVLYDMNFQIKAIDIESEALKRFCKIETEKNAAIMSFFSDGGEDFIGMYVYKGDLLSGWRILPKDVYDHYSLKTEMEVIVNNCKMTFEEFELDEFHIVSERIEDLRRMKEIYKNEEINYKYHPFHTSIGLMLRTEKPEKKKRKVKKNEG